MASGSMIWWYWVQGVRPQPTPNITLALASSSQLWVGTPTYDQTQNMVNNVILNPATGAVLSQGFAATGCELFTPAYAVCANASQFTQQQMTVYDISSLPPTVAWTTVASPLLIAPDQGASGVLVAQLKTGVLAGFDLDSGKAVWRLDHAAAVGGEYAAPGTTTAAYAAGVLWVSWQGYDADLAFAVNVASFSLAAGGAAPALLGKASRPSFAEMAAPTLTVDASGLKAYLTMFDGAKNSIVVLQRANSTTAAALGADGVAAAPGMLAADAIFTAPLGYNLSAFPGPTEGHLIVGFNNVTTGPTLAIY